MKLNIRVKDVSSCEKVLTIDVPEEAVEQEYNSFYEAVARRAKVPGFRPGRAPKQVVRLHFKNEAREKVLRELLARSLREAVREKEIPFIGNPEVDQIEFDEKRLKFNAHLELKPKVKIDSYAGMPLNRDAVSVSQSEMEEALKRIQEAHAKFLAVEHRPAEMGDFLICDYRLTMDGREIEKRNGDWIELREQERLFGFSKQLVGIKSGETRETVVLFPLDHHKKELAGKEGRFFVTAKEIKEKKIPPLDDELAKEIGAYDTLEELKQAIHRDFESRKQAAAEVKLENALLEELIRSAKFDLPSRMVARRLKSLVEEQVHRALERGMKEDEIRARITEFEKNLAPQAERDVRLSFILDEIANREHITVEEKDVEAKYGWLAGRFRKSVEEMKAVYAKDEDRQAALRLQVLQEKTIQWIKDKAVIQETKSD